MKKKVFNYLFILSSISLCLYACVKKTTYPKVPKIEYKAFFPYVGDSADLELKFTDGDGDIGVSESDTVRTLFVTYYYKDPVTSQFRAYYSPIFNDTLRTGYIVRAPNDSYKNKPISGEVSVRLQQYRHSNIVKNLKYVVYMFDKAGNKSNVFTSPELIVN